MGTSLQEHLLRDTPQVSEKALILNRLGSQKERKEIGKLETACNIGAVTEELRGRKLTPLECWRLQGFPDWAFNKAQEVNSDSQLYKQAGNSVTVTVVSYIGSLLKNRPKE